MVGHLIIGFELVAVVGVVAIVAGKILVPAPILFVLAGLGLALLPNVPSIGLEPDLVLYLFLPPLVYVAATQMSFRDFRRNLRPIALLAVGCVLFTTGLVGVAAHAVLDFSWPMAFVLGAVLSPSDEVAAIAIARRLKVPRRLLIIVEGEGLANDATALVLYRFGLVALERGQVSLTQAAAEFVAIVVGETLFGFFVGWAMTRLRRVAHDPRVEVTFSLLTPFVAYWPAEAVGGSGVLATVAAGLYVGNAQFDLVRFATRLHAAHFWEVVVFLGEGVLFLLTGLQAKAIVSRLEHIPWTQLTAYGLGVSALVIVTRFVWVFPATYLSRWVADLFGRQPHYPAWQQPFFVAFIGMRGAISLAAAMAIPLNLSPVEGRHRDLVLFLTFCVILVTLVGQGLALPWVIRWLGLTRAGRAEADAERREELAGRIEAVRAGLERLDQLAREEDLPPKLVEVLRTRHAARIRHLEHHAGDGEAHKLAELAERIGHEMLEAERQRVRELSDERRLSDAARRRIEAELDLEEARLAREAELS